MKSFNSKIFWFLLPIIIIVSPVIILLKGTGENFSSIDDIIKSNEKYLIGYSYNEKNYSYLKWKTCKEQDRKVIWALGSSRVLQFREDMFDSSFYNVGYTISSISDFLPFTKSLPQDKYPSVLIIGLDQWMFNDSWISPRGVVGDSYWENSFSYTPASKQVYVSVLKDLFNHKYEFSVLTETYDSENEIYKIGLNAIVNNKGFRNDGSMLYGSQIDMLLKGEAGANDYEYSDTYKRIEEGNRRFEYGDKASVNAFLKLEEFLKFCSDNNIYVVGFFPPFAKKVHERIIESGKYGYLNQIYPRSNDLFKKYNFELWDLTNIEKYNSGDNETLDGFHGGELTYLKMLIFMIHNKSILQKYSDVNRLEQAVFSRIDNYTVFK